MFVQRHFLIQRASDDFLPAGAAFSPAKPKLTKNQSGEAFKKTSKFYRKFFDLFRNLNELISIGIRLAMYKDSHMTHSMVYCWITTGVGI
jgi:hypothetical protein